MGTMVKSSTGVVAYVLVEDDAEALKEANQKIDQVLQCFWVSARQLPKRRILMAMQLENIIAGGLVLSDVHQTVKDQEGWLAKFGATVDKHFKVRILAASSIDFALTISLECRSGQIEACNGCCVQFASSCKG